MGDVINGRGGARTPYSRERVRLKGKYIRQRQERVNAIIRRIKIGKRVPLFSCIIGS